MILLQAVMLLLTIIFAVVHSGMASLRESGEKLIGERAYRVLFAAISLPLVVTTIVSPGILFTGICWNQNGFIVLHLRKLSYLVGILYKSSV
jgi:hypothetical protein